MNLCFKQFVGIKGSIDWDMMDGGHVSTIVNAIIFKSGYYMSYPLESLNLLLPEVSFVETVQAIVARFLMIPMPDVVKMPVHLLFRYYAICIKSFPSEVNMPHKEEPEDGQSVSDFS